MARSSRTPRTRTRTRNHRGTATQRPLPWVLLSNAAEVLRERPFSLSVADRDRLRALVIKSGGRGITLSPRERNELALIVERADIATRTLPTPLVASRRRRVA